MNNNLIETLISSFNDKGTLLKWLKELEKAIKESNIRFVQNVEIIEKGNNTYALAVAFEGGNILTSNDFVVTDNYYYHNVNISMSPSSTPSTLPTFTSVNISFISTKDFETSEELIGVLPDGILLNVSGGRYNNHILTFMKDGTNIKCETLIGDGTSTDIHYYNEYTLPIGEYNITINSKKKVKL